MREILGVTDEPRTIRRWFHDEFFDLFVWQAGSGEVTLFQLCYGIDSSERALVWHKYGGFFHDGGEPTSVDDPVVARFQAAAPSLPEDIREFVIARLREYAEKKSAFPARRKQFRRAEWQRKSASRRSSKASKSV